MRWNVMMCAFVQRGALSPLWAGPCDAAVGAGERVLVEYGALRILRPEAEPPGHSGMGAAATSLLLGGHYAVDDVASM